MKLKMIINVLGIILVSCVLWYAHNAIYQLSEPFIEMEETEAKFIVELVTDNYKEIKSMSNKEKNTVISNFKDIGLASTNIKFMRDVALFILYATFSGLILFLSSLLVLTYRKGRIPCV